MVLVQPHSILDGQVATIYSIQVNRNIGNCLESQKPTIAIRGYLLAKHYILDSNAVLVFSVAWPIFPSIGYVSLLEDPIAALRHLTLPALCMGAALAGAIARMTRSEMIEQLGKDYIITARAKGLSPQEVTYRHALRNSLITVVTFTGLEFGTLLGGAIIVETIFAWPGVGKWMYDAVMQRDYMVIRSGTLFIATIFVVINLCVDVLYAVINPRISVK